MAREEGFIGNSKSRRESRRFHEKRGREKKVMRIKREEKQKAMKTKNRRERRREKKRIEEEEKRILEEKRMNWMLDEENKFNRFVSEIEGELGVKIVDDAVSVNDLMKHLKKNSKRRSKRKNSVYFRNYLEVLAHGFDGEEESVLAVMKIDAKDSFHWKKTILAAYYKGYAISLD